MTKDVGVDLTKFKHIELFKYLLEESEIEYEEIFLENGESLLELDGDVGVFFGDSGELKKLHQL